MPAAPKFSHHLCRSNIMMLWILPTWYEVTCQLSQKMLQIYIGQQLLNAILGIYIGQQLLNAILGMLFIFPNQTYSRVPNKRDGGENNQGGVEMARYNNIGGGCLEKLKIVVFLGKHVSLIYLCEQ